VGDSEEKSLSPKTWGGFWDFFGVILVDLVNPREGAYVLDFGTGAGSVLYPMADRVGHSGKIFGIEKSNYWVEKTSAEIERCNVTNAEIQFMDGREMTFANDYFDCVVAGFIGWDNYFDFKNLEYRVKDDPMIREIKRVLKPGGIFGLSTWLVQKDLDWMYELLNSNSISCRTCYSAENEAGWKIIMEKAGFREVRFFPRSVAFTYTSKDEWWKEMRDYDWTIDNKDNELITDTIKEQAYKSVQKYATEDGGVKFTRQALIVTGQK
jgi:SAM-dependent methyltransferase